MENKTGRIPRNAQGLARNIKRLNLERGASSWELL